MTDASTDRQDEILFATEDDVLTITLNRPHALNAVDGTMLAAAVDAVEKTDARVIVMTGAGRAFCAGADLNRVGDGGTQEHGNALVRALLLAPRPVVAAVNGPAAGIGASVALAADFTVAHESAYFLQAFINIGLMPDGGGTHLFAASLGRARANRLAMLGERLPATEAAGLGLVSSVHPAGEFEEAVQTLVGKLASGPTAAYAETKAALNAVTLAGLNDAMERELAGQRRLHETFDSTEGIDAFLEKRPARFEGR